MPDTTSQNAVKILLVIPCLRERARLPGFLPSLLTALREAGAPVDVLVADDGSGPEEQAWLAGWLESLRPAWPELLAPVLLTENAGKGGAVYAGWAAAGPQHTHAAFVDADGAVPPRETARLCLEAARHPSQAVFAVRTGTAGTRVRRHPARALAGHFFRLLVKLLFRFPVPETQCGCKAVPLPAWQAYAPALTERRFCFDVDLTWHLLRHGLTLRPLPVDWTEIAGGQLRASSVLAMIRSLITLRRRLGPWRSGLPVAGEPSSR